MSEIAELKAELEKLRTAVTDLQDVQTRHALTLSASVGNLPTDAVLNPDGSITLSCQMTFLNPFDINTTGVGSITVLPGGNSLASFLPLLGRGDNGLAPTLMPTGILHQVPDGTALPNPNFKVNLVDPGSVTPAVAPKYQLELWLNAGPAGPAGTPVNLASLADVVAPDGGLLPGVTVVYRTPDGAPAGWYVEPLRLTDIAVCNAFTPASGNQPNQTMGSLTFPQRSYQRRGILSGSALITPAADTTNGITHIDLIARLGGTTDDKPIIAFGQGLSTNIPFVANLQPTPAALNASAILDTGAGATVYLIAQQSNPTLSNWSATGVAFTGLAVAI